MRLAITDPQYFHQMPQALGQTISKTFDSMVRINPFLNPSFDMKPRYIDRNQRRMDGMPNL